MADPFVAEIRIFPFNFPPKGWAFCDGQILPISQNTALFSLLGTTYGGDGKSTFALPNLQDTAPLHVGGAQPGPGLTFRDLGEQSGGQTVTLLQTEMPAHSHSALAFAGNSQVSPASNTWGSGTKASGGTVYAPAAAAQVQMNPFATSVAGGSQPHNNMMPFLTLRFCIALQGVFPPRT